MHSERRVLRVQKLHLPARRPDIYHRPRIVKLCFGGGHPRSPRLECPVNPLLHRFGFHNGSSIDSLLDKDDVSLEAILDEDDLLQECKAQNTRLIDYFQRLDVLQRLLGYVTGQIEGEDRGRFKCVLGLYHARCQLTFNIFLWPPIKVSLRRNRSALQ